ncbi:M-protein, striated muscle isoform X2 [Clupea harengus]|uniref:M-protein, striated muscle isoform X2 n=1 Tax=Clupea harengus TaxID=7950 RepID=A0A6P8ETB2_CLUHA|nr:M-protein, striated muscle isoform X2 [Clupea harengus]
MPTTAIPFYQQKQKHVHHHSTKKVVQHHSSRKSSSKSVRKEQAEASTAMAEPAYTVPAFKERNADDVPEYQRVAAHCGKGLAELQKELTRIKVATHTQVTSLAITREVQEMMSIKKKIAVSADKAPEFLVELRAHTLWEKMPAKLFCTVGGNPAPIVKWYKGDKPVDPLSAPGKYKMESKYGVHSLIISRCTVSDTAQYSAVATNTHGKATTKATVTVKRPAGVGDLPLLPGSVPITPTHPSKLDVTLLEAFGVTFGTEGGSCKLVANLVVVPDLPNLPPDVMWFRDATLLAPSKWAEMSVGGGAATLTFPHLNKDDEGLYTVRIWCKDGTVEHSAYLFVKDAAPSVAGAPGAPMDVKASDANKDYVMVTWKPPNITTEGAIKGYFVDRRKVGSTDWVQCNDSPVNICKYPVSGLSVGHSYHFRVRAVNSVGISIPSRRSDGVSALHSAAGEVEVIKIDGKYDIVIYQEDLEGYVTLPGPPTEVHASEINRTFIVLSWTPPNPCGRAPLWYLIEKSVGDSQLWQRLNTAVQLCSPRYPIFDLEDGKAYRFRVTAVNRYGPSEASEPSHLIQKSDPHGSENAVGVPSAPGKVVATRNSKSSVFVQWDAPKHPNNLVGYYIDACMQGAKAWVPCNHRPYKNTRFVVHGLVQGETYAFRVQAVNAYGLGEESQESDPLFVDAALTAPSAPHGITMLSCEGSSMTLAWKRPKNAGGTKISAYYVDQREASTLRWREINTAALKERVYKVENLTAGVAYEFKIQAGNLAGVGVPSEPSKPFLCEAWTMAEPGPAYDIKFSEVRDHSMIVQWKAPVFAGQGPVTGYLLEKAKKGSKDFVAVTEGAINHRFFKVKGLEAGAAYVFRVRAVNEHGTGKASAVSDSVVAKALAGTKEIVCGVDEESGDIFLSFDACEIAESSKFVWSKSYKEIADSGRVTVSSKGKHSKLTFTHPEAADLGIYSVAVTDTDGVSASHKITEEDLKKMLELSYNIRHPIVPLKITLSYEVLEKGHVRFWLQCLKMSPAVSYRFIFNNKEVVNGEGIKISHDVATGVIQMMVEHFTRDNEGSYTVQITDGKAKNQSSLVLVGDVFKAALKEADFQRKEFVRKQGPHFSEYISFYVEDDCTVMLTCKLANVKKETTFHWFKEDEEIVLDAAPNVMSGSCTLPIPMFSRKDHGVYKATLSDDRGKDTSVFDISGTVFDDIINAIAHIAGSSASELVLQCTPEGIRLQCYMKYFTEEMKSHWFHKDAKIASSEKMRIGGTAEMAWMQICEPTDKEKGHYTIEIQDATMSHNRTFDLSGQAYADAYAEFQRLKAAAFAEKNRGRVVGGLPDVVTIMEKKSLSLTCTVWGEPTPEVTWFKNEQEVVSDPHNKIAFEGGKYASLNINTVTVDDSGKYSINVRNKYGGEFVEITVSVYKQGDDVPEPKLGQMSKPGVPPKSPAPAARVKSPTPTPPPSVKSPTPAPPPARVKSPTPTPPPSVKSPSPAPPPARVKSPSPAPPPARVKSPTPTPPPSVKSPTPVPPPKSPTPPRSAKSPTPPRFMKSPSPARK